MSVIENIFASREVKVSDIRNPDLWLTNSIAGVTTVSGQSIDSEKAWGLPAYYACIRCIAEDISTVPFKTYKRIKPRGREESPDHPVYELFEGSPNPMMTAQAWREMMLANTLSWGNGYAEILRDTRRNPRELWPIHPSCVTPKIDKDNVLSYEVNSLGEPPRTIESEDMFHIHGLGSNGVTGFSVIRFAAESIGLGLAAQNFGASLFGNGIRPSGVLEHPGKLGPKEKKNLRASYEDMHRGSEKANRMLILEEDMKFKPFSIPPEEAQFLETRQFQVVDIARWFRMPPHMIQDLIRATYSNIEHQSTEYTVFTLRPWAVRFEKEARRKFFQNDAEYYAEHNLDAYLRGDNDSRSNYYVRQWGIGALSQNDIREKENMNPIEGGDTYYVPLNMVRTEDAAAGGTVPQQDTRDDDNEPGPPDANNPSTLNLERIKKSQKFVFEDVMGRILRKESKAAIRAVQRHAGSHVGFEKWINRFFDEHREYMLNALSGPVWALVELTGGNVSRLPIEIKSYVESHIDKSRNFLVAVFDQPGAEHKITEISESLIATMARELMDMICGE